MGKLLETSQHQTAFLIEEEQKDCRGDAFSTTGVRFILQGSRHHLTGSHDLYGSWLCQPPAALPNLPEPQFPNLKPWSMTPASPVMRDDAGEVVFIFSALD